MKPLLAILSLAVLFTACTKQPSPTVVVDPALAMLVPSDTTMLAGIKMEPLRATPLYKKYVTDQQWPPQVLDFIKETGLDPRKDIWELLTCSDGKSTVIMARGRFSVAELEPQLDKQGAQKTKYKSYTLPSMISEYLYANPGNGALKNQAFRQDLLKAVDVGTVTKQVYFGHGEQATQVYPEAAYPGDKVRIYYKTPATNAAAYVSGVPTRTASVSSGPVGSIQQYYVEFYAPDFPSGTYSVQLYADGRVSKEIPLTIH